MWIWQCLDTFSPLFLWPVVLAYWTAELEMTMDWMFWDACFLLEEIRVFVLHFVICCGAPTHVWKLKHAELTFNFSVRLQAFPVWPTEQYWTVYLSWFWETICLYWDITDFLSVTEIFMYFCSLMCCKACASSSALEQTLIQKVNHLNAWVDLCKLLFSSTFS